MQDLKVVLDIGNLYIKGVVFAKDEWKTIILAKDMVKVKWLRKWKILDMDDFVLSIDELLSSFNKKLWWDYIDEVYIWISHPEIKIKRLSEQKRIMDNTITEADKEYLLNVIYETSWELNYSILKLMPFQWIIDEEIKVKDPNWMEWKKIEVFADVFLLPKAFYNTLEESFDKIDVTIVDIVPNILWASENTLDFESKDLWSLLIDIWNNQTSYVVYEEGYPILYWTLPIWWEEVTKDISIWLQIDIKEAESVKREKWFIQNYDLIEDDTIDVKFLSDVITARYEEIFETINQRLLDIWKDWKLPGWAVLIWWWSKIKWLDILAKQVFLFACFFWKDKSMLFWDLGNNLQFINVLWDYLWLNKYSTPIKRWFSFGWSFGGFSKLIEWIKKMF